MKCLILVGGFGTRLRPLTLTLPKPLVEFANKPTIVHQIEALVQVGVREIILAINYKPELMSNNLSHISEKYGVKIIYSQETEPLGTAGPIALAKDYLINDCFFVLNSDIICNFPFQEMIEFHRSHGKEGTILVTKVEEPSKYGVVVAKTNGQIMRFVEKPKEYVGNKINAGIYLFNPSILDKIELRPTSIEKEVFPQMALDEQLYCMDLNGFWMDVGQPKDMLYGLALYLNDLKMNHSNQLKIGKGFIGPVLIDNTSRISEGCLIGPNVSIGPNCIIEEGVRIRDSILLEGVTIASNSFIKNSIIGWKSTIGNWCRIENISVLGQDVHVDDEIFVNGGKILPHKTISTNVPEPAIIM
eukprot:TRINITY_DN6753_c0_g1_i1.p1 TRINITY_DN6753_c0_g1~~TRINITY_DN6753_c0_g1_i1.p1  ORF type:complete len:358 (-),score=165.00 TRINITY_DN6753_c0_g1_i1:245-1318(-)